MITHNLLSYHSYFYPINIATHNFCEFSNLVQHENVYEYIIQSYHSNSQFLFLSVPSVCLVIL